MRSWSAAPRAWPPWSRSSAPACSRRTATWTGRRWDGWCSATRDARRRLEGIVHPLVYERITELEAEAPADAVVVHDIPLLTENARAGDFDAVIVVDVPEEVQVERMVRDRGWTEDDARSRIGAQATREQRNAIATYVVDNTGTHEDLRHRVAEVLAELTG